MHSLVSSFQSLVSSEATLAVLAGGQGSRMGRAKGALRLGGRPILDYLLDRFEWTGPTLLVTAPGREHPPGWERFGREVVDPVAGEGPLRGLHTALAAVSTPLLLVTTVDMPGVGRGQLEWLAGQLETRPATAGLMTSRQPAGAFQIEPFPSAFRRQALDMVARRLSGASRSVYSLSREDAVMVLPAPEEWMDDTWANLNTPDDLARYGR